MQCDAGGVCYQHQIQAAIHSIVKLGHWVADFLQFTWQQEILCQLQLANKKREKKSQFIKEKDEHFGNKLKELVPDCSEIQTPSKCY